MSQPAALPKGGHTIFHVDEPLPSSAPDFFSNNYLSLSTNTHVRDIFLRKVLSAPPNRLLGSTGSRLATGHSIEYKADSRDHVHKTSLAPRPRCFFGSGFNANLAFVSAVPQKNDAIIHDEFLHSLYSMDGDFCPLREIVEIVEALVPAGHAHIVVDEAHTSGVFGPNRTYLVAVWTSPLIRDYTIHFAKDVMFSTSMSYTDIDALEACLAVISSAYGQELRERVYHLSLYTHDRLTTALKNVPETILALDNPDAPSRDLRPWPVLPDHPRLHPSREIRVIIHAVNTETQIDTFTNELVAWVDSKTRAKL
ncbi:Pyridoxal phosphate-dependent transferase [Tylopilus felleus]